MKKTAALVFAVSLIATTSPRPLFAAERALECLFSCSLRARIQDQGDSISIHYWNYDVIGLHSYLGQSATEALVASQVISYPKLLIDEIYFTVPKSSCKQSPDYLGVMQCDAKGVTSHLSGFFFVPSFPPLGPRVPDLITPLCLVAQADRFS